MKATFVVERIEGVWAILETEQGDSFQFPVNQLPKPLSEGTHLVFTIDADKKAQEMAQAKMRSLRDSLKKG
jgi:hypothetical protein